MAETRQRDADHFEKRCREIEQEEERRLERGELSAGELARLGSWAAGRDAERAARQGELVCARTAVSEAREHVDEEQRLLAHARAEAEVVKRHEARWEQQQRKERLGVEDDEASENHWNRHCAKVER